MNELDEKQFQRAVAEAIRGVLNVYREADALLRELRDGLRAGTPAFSPIADRVVPGPRGDSDARYLRRYIATILSPSTAVAEDEPEEDEPDEEDEDEDDAGDGKSKKKKLLTLDVGASLLVARVSLYGPGGVEFVPKLTITSLRNVRLDGGPTSGPLKMSRNRYRKLVRIIDTQEPGPGVFRPKLSTHPVNAPKDKRGLVFDVPAPPLTFPLFTLTPQRLEAVADEVRHSWA